MEPPTTVNASDKSNGGEPLIQSGRKPERPTKEESSFESPALIHQSASKRYDPNHPLISIHIPKCGGTSFLSVLREWYGSGFLEHYVNERRNQPPERHDLNKLRSRPVCIHGHFNYQRGNGPDVYYPEANQFITIVREPFEHHLSDYYYAKRQSRKGVLYRSGVDMNAVACRQTLQEFLSERRKSYIPNFFPPEMNFSNYKDILEERYIYIGLCEDLQRSVDSLAYLLGRAAVEIGHLNKSAWDEVVSDDLQVRFREENELAYAIYEYAKANYAGTTGGEPTVRLALDRPSVFQRCIRLFYSAFSTSGKARNR